MSTPLFDHEKLRAYQEALRFSSWVEPIIEQLPTKLSAKDQLDRASTSIALNIAESLVGSFSMMGSTQEAKRKAS